MSLLEMNDPEQTIFQMIRDRTPDAIVIYLYDWYREFYGAE